MAPPFVTANVTAPWATVFADSLNPNSDGLPAVTAIVAAVRTGLACATGTATRTSAASADSRTRACLVMRLLPPGTGSEPPAETAPDLQPQFLTVVRARAAEWVSQSSR